MKKITFLVLALTISIFSFGQIIIKGKVHNDSIPLESASVIIKNSKNGTSTNSIGEFKIEAKKGDTLSISYIGYKTKEIVVNQDEIFRIRLDEDGQLNEVVVVAYGMTSKVAYCICPGIICYLDCDEKSDVLILDAIDKQNKLHPNPSLNGIFQLKLNENYKEVKISISNISGQTIQNATHQKFGEKLNIDLSQSAAGIYVINIVADGKPLEAIKAIRG